MTLREKCIEAMAKAWVAYEGDEWDDINSSGMAAIRACVEREFDALLDALVENATPLYDAGGIAPAYYIDDEPDEDTIWVIDLAVLRGDTE